MTTAWVKRFLVVFLLAAAWVALLWFVLVPDFTHWTWGGAIALHVLPPLALVGAGWGWHRWREQRNASAIASREAAAQAQADQAREAAKQRHLAEVAEQRRYCECRAVALAQVSRTDQGEPLFGLGGGDFLLSEALAPPVDLLSGGVLESLRPALAEALSHLYGQCPAAVRFPHYLVPPAQAVGEEVLALVRELYDELVAERGEPPGVSFLPTGDYVANTLLKTVSDGFWPGAVVLAFDAPWLARAMGQNADEAPGEAELWLGQPGQGIFALVVTRAGLNQTLKTLGDLGGGQGAAGDVMTPYWQKEVVTPGSDEALARLTRAQREALAECPILARIHRAYGAMLDTDGPREGLRPMALVNVLQGLLEKARLSAGMVDSPFPSDGENAAVQAVAQQAAEAPLCDWLVHNAGSVERSGQRVAALGLALLNQGVEVDPIDAATNVTVQSGDWGQARSVGLLALAVARVAAGAGAVLTAEYPGLAEVATGFVAAPGKD